MSATAFSFTSPNTLASQPNGAGEKLIYRSDDASDTANLSITGLVAAVSTTDTAALTGMREVQTADTYTTLSIAKLSAAATGTVRIYGQGTAAIGYVIFTTQPANNDTVLIGLAGFLQTYTFKTTLTGAANEILRGADATASALNLKKAINNEGTAGTHYGTGTVANAYCSATVSGTIVILTDRIPILRQLAWSVTQTVGATLSMLAPIGGVTGTLLASLTAGTTLAYDNFTLSSEDLVATTLPALFTGSSDAINIGGRDFSLVLKAANLVSAVACNYQTSTDGTNWATHLTAITSLDDMSVATPQFVLPGELRAEFVRFNVTANANTTDSQIDAKAVFG